MIRKNVAKLIHPTLSYSKQYYFNLSKLNFSSKNYNKQDLPYMFGGMKFLNSCNKNPSKSFQQFDEIKLQIDSDEENDENIFEIQESKIQNLNHDTKIYFNSNIISTLRSNLKYSKQFQKALDDLYIDYSQNLVQILNSHLTKNNTLTNANSSLRQILNENFYKKLLYEDNSFLIKRNENVEKNTKFKLTLHRDEKNKNKFYLDKIFLHCNYDKIIGENIYLDNIENVFNKNLIIFNYMRKRSYSKEEKFSNFLSNFSFNSFLSDEDIYKKSQKKMIVRFSIWAKISDSIILESTAEESEKIEKVNALKIYDDEWHHILVEMEDNSNDLKYLNAFPNFSFTKLVSRIIKGNKTSLLSFENELKIADFDFYMKGNPLNSRRTGVNSYKDEFYYIKKRM